MATPIYLATAINGDEVVQNVFTDEIFAKFFVEDEVKFNGDPIPTWSGLLYYDSNDDSNNYGRVDVITAGLSNSWNYHTN